METEKVENIKPEQPSAPKSNKKGIIIALIIVIIAVSIGGVILGNQLLEDNKENKEDIENKDDEDNNEYNYFLDVYRGDFDIICEETDVDCEQVAKIPVKNKESVALEIYSIRENKKDVTKHILYADGEDLKLYNNTTGKIKDLDLKNNYNSYQIQPTCDYKDVVGIALGKAVTEEQEKYTYYDINTGKLLLEEKYPTMFTICGDYLEVSTYTNQPDDSEEKHQVSLYNIKQGKNILTEKGLPTYMRFDVEVINDKMYIYKITGDTGEGLYTVYNNEYKVIVNEKYESKWGFTEDNNIYIVDKNRVVKINYKGEVISTSKEYSTILYADSKFTVYHDNKNVYITDDNKFSLKLIEWKNDYSYEPMVSGYFDEYKCQDNIKPAGYYFIFYYGQDDETGIELYFNQTTKELTKKDIESVSEYTYERIYCD